MASNSSNSGQHDQYNSTVILPESKYRVHQKLYDQYKSSMSLNNQYETRTIPNNAETGNVLRRDTILMTKEASNPNKNRSGTSVAAAPKRYVTFYQENVYKRENSNENGSVGETQVDFGYPRNVELGRRKVKSDGYIYWYCVAFIDWLLGRNLIIYVAENQGICIFTVFIVEL